jgi:peptidyl-tRNA hydrolase, PTH2 family
METKQVIVLRKDLNMRKGKMVAQGAHASVQVCLELERESVKWDEHPHEKAYREWINGLQTKICVGVSNEQELRTVYEAARSAGLPCSLIIDAGKTEFGGVPTPTAVAVGPCENDKLTPITGHLALL